jgi:hypothetical protein
MFTAEEIEVGKFYSKGDTSFYKLLERTGNTVESYPGAFSNLYVFEIVHLNSGFCHVETKESAFNPNYTCFSEINIESLEEHLIELEKVVKMIKKLKEN